MSCGKDELISELIGIIPSGEDKKSKCKARRKKRRLAASLSVSYFVS